MSSLGSHHWSSGYSNQPGPWPVKHQEHSSPGAGGVQLTLFVLIGRPHRAHRYDGSIVSVCRVMPRVGGPLVLVPARHSQVVQPPLGVW
jgi:hypothetical protein